MKGYIHSIETMGTVDGPGIRFVVFLQGCPMRCLYCHNPDTWNVKGGKEITADEVIRQCLRYKSFLRNGGITLTGGEPLLQLEFVTEVFRIAKAEGIHTCLDTSGITFVEGEKFDLLMEYTDLILLDIKHIREENHKNLTGASNRNILKFAQYLSDKQVPVWIRHVVVPGYTDSPDSLEELGYFIGGLSNVKALDVLPYHTMGKEKYKQLGMDYPLDEVPPLAKDEALEARKCILQGIKKRRNSNSSS